MSTSALKVLLVDDEPDIIEFLSYNLKRNGFEVYAASNGLDAIELAQRVKPEMILLDIMMPKMDGMAVCRQLRNIPLIDRTIIVFLTAREDDLTHISALEAGGDDFITKPIKPAVLISRINALLRRMDRNSFTGQNIEVNGLVINREEVSVLVNGQKMFLPKKEFEILYLLASHPEKVFNRDEIYNKVWGDDVIVGNRTIDVHIRKLREKIGNDKVVTIKGIGYKMVN